jgi:hypothetical protein
LRLSSTFSAWTKAKSTKLRGLPNLERIRDCLDVCYGEQLQTLASGTTRGDLVKNLWANASQGVQRRPWSRDKGTLTCGSLWYSFETDSTLDGTDFLRIHGHPALMSTGGITERDLKDLGGEGFSVPIVTLIASAVYFLPWADWWQP